VFVSKTLFCNHLNIVLASDAARREIASATGDRADATMVRLAADVAAEPDRWPVLGFFGDASLFDTALDRDVTGDAASAIGAAAAYRRLFLAACATGRWPTWASSSVRWPMEPRSPGRPTDSTQPYHDLGREHRRLPHR
jgi:hypothetical protein